MSIDILDYIQKWYLIYCNGYWEHTYGFFKITTKQKSWNVNISLMETKLEDISYQPQAINIYRNESDFFTCRFRSANHYKTKEPFNAEFEANGCAKNLIEILEKFYEWSNKVENIPAIEGDNQELIWLQQWLTQTPEVKERIYINTLGNPGWEIFINLENTSLIEKSFRETEIERSDDDWVHSRIKNSQLQIFGGPLNLKEMICIFQKWVTET